jgi:RNA polymerase sigma-70 factor (ECF subfamily)
MLSVPARRFNLSSMTDTSPFDYESALLACAQGERFALKAIYERESRWLLGVALRIVRERQAAEDVLQDAFLQIWKGAGSFNPKLGSGRGWIYTVVRHRALNEVRKAGREVPVEDDALNALADAGQSPFAASASEHDADPESLERCLKTLDEQKRRCIVFAFVDGYTHDQIAKRLGSPLGTVKSAIRRGLLSLKECLS